MNYLGFAKYMNFTTQGDKDGIVDVPRKLQRTTSQAEQSLKNNVKMQVGKTTKMIISREAMEVDFNSRPKRDSQSWAGILPQLGRNVMSVVVADNNNTYIAGASRIKWIVDIVLWLFFPIIGGLVGIATFIAFESDKLAFHHMGLDQSKVYQGTMLFLKGILLGTLLGPKFMHDDPDHSTYYPKRDMNPSVIPETVTVEAPEPKFEMEPVVVKEKEEPFVNDEDEFDDDDEPFDTDNSLEVNSF